jgi:hypothetical protein
MPSQFAKRKAKEKAPEIKVEQPQLVESVNAEPGDVPEGVLTHTAYDVFEDGTKHMIVTLKYNPDTGDASVVEIKEISRHIGLVHENQKRALATLKTY